VTTNVVESKQAAALWAKKILIVDDDPGIRESFQILLEAVGCYTETAADHDEAVAMIEQWKPDLVTTDLAHPVKSGMDLVRWVQRRKPSIPVVILTGARPSVTLSEECIAMGASACMFLPIDVRVVGKTLNAALAGRDDGNREVARTGDEFQATGPRLFARNVPDPKCRWCHGTGEVPGFTATYPCECLER
jgi:DNA-binding NtrC family response regulator